MGRDLMTAADLLANLARLGVEVVAYGDRLRYRPRSAVTPDLVERLKTHKAALPHMADFARWATAAERALGWEKGTFMAAYKGNRTAANEVALEASPVAQPLLELLEEESGWTGKSSALAHGGRVQSDLMRHEYERST